ncbi:MAG: hypothetical protein H6733_03245 [Alphaproteobacteria bacterium]|nr:hypothetical protein [Alphaproteobacteria bacterium]
MASLVAGTWEAPEHPLTVPEEELPVGFIHPGPYTDREHQFAVAVPSMALLMILLLVGAVGSAIAGASTTPLHGMDGVVAIGGGTVLAIATALTASRAGWGHGTAAGPWRPLLYGLVVGLSVMAIVGWAAWFAVVPAS